MVFQSLVATATIISSKELLSVRKGWRIYYKINHTKDYLLRYLQAFSELLRGLTMELKHQGASVNWKRAVGGWLWSCRGLINKAK